MAVVGSAVAGSAVGASVVGDGGGVEGVGVGREAADAGLVAADADAGPAALAPAVRVLERTGDVFTTCQADCQRGAEATYALPPAARRRSVTSRIPTTMHHLRRRGTSSPTLPAPESSAAAIGVDAPACFTAMTSMNSTNKVMPCECLHAPAGRSTAASPPPQQWGPRAGIQHPAISNLKSNQI